MPLTPCPPLLPLLSSTYTNPSLQTPPPLLPSPTPYVPPNAPPTAQLIIIPIHLPDHFTLAVYCIFLFSSPILFHIDSTRSPRYKELLIKLSPHMHQLLSSLLPHYSLPDPDPVFLDNFPLQSQDFNCSLHATQNILYILRLFHTVSSKYFLPTLTSLEVPPIDYSLFRTLLHAHLTRTPPPFC